MIGIIDYGMGNLKSVLNAFEHIGEKPFIIRDIPDFKKSTHLVLPGVGTYSTAIKNLKQKEFLKIILEETAAGKPLMGICLGMQILSDFGTESTHTLGLGFIPGIVEKIITTECLPHIGWNNIEFKKDHYLFQGIKKDVDFYFVHSYRFIADEKFVYGTTDYSTSINAIVAKDNIIGFQFHPEKSQENGLRLLENFSHWDGKC